MNIGTLVTFKPQFNESGIWEVVAHPPGLPNGVVWVKPHDVLLHHGIPALVQDLDVYSGEREMSGVRLCFCGYATLMDTETFVDRDGNRHARSGCYPLSNPLLQLQGSRYSLASADNSFNEEAPVCKCGIKDLLSGPHPADCAWFKQKGGR